MNILANNKEQEIIDYAPVEKFRVKIIQPERITIMFLLDLWRFTTVTGSFWDRFAIGLLLWSILPVIMFITFIFILIYITFHLIAFIFKLFIKFIFFLLRPILYPLLAAIGLILLYGAYKIGFLTWLINLF